MLIIVLMVRVRLRVIESSVNSVLVEVHRFDIMLVVEGVV